MLESTGETSDGRSLGQLKDEIVLFFFFFKEKVTFRDTGTSELPNEGQGARRAANSAARLGGGLGRGACVCPPHRPSHVLALCGSRKAGSSAIVWELNSASLFNIGSSSALHPSFGDLLFGDCRFA